MEDMDINSPSHHGVRRKRLSKEAEEMITIRNKLGMSQPDFALELGETRDKIINIENGRIKHIPLELLQKARDLFEAEKDSRAHPLEELLNMDMREIMERWWSMIGASNDKEAAILLGTTTTTIDRWRKATTRPRKGDLLRFELVAQKLMKRRKGSA